MAVRLDTGESSMLRRLGREGALGGWCGAGAFQNMGGWNHIGPLGAVESRSGRTISAPESTR